MSKRGCGGCLLLPVLLGLGLFLYTEVQPSTLPHDSSPSWIDNIFANAVVLGAVRLALIAGLIYLVISLIGLVSEGRWLSEIGPAKASKAAEPIARLDDTLKTVEGALKDSLDTIRGLKIRLVESDEALGRAQGDIQSLLDYVDTLEKEKGEP